RSIRIICVRANISARATCRRAIFPRRKSSSRRLRTAVPAFARSTGSSRTRSCAMSPRANLAIGRPDMTTATRISALLASFAVAFTLAQIAPPAMAVEEMRQFNKDDDVKTGKTKVCPKGERYSERKRDCVKTSCGTGRVWRSGAEAGLGGNSAALSDKDLYLAAGDLVLDAHYADALPLLFRIKGQNNPQVLNLIGYSTRKLGDVDKGIEYYRQALAIDPNYTKARQYLG